MRVMLMTHAISAYETPARCSQTRVLVVASMNERPELGLLLESIRIKKRFSKKALAEASGVSDTYIAQIESGYDSRTGKEIHPSPDVLRLLARALGDGDGSEEEQLYTRFGGAAGFIPMSLVRDAQGSTELPSEPLNLDVALRAIRETDELSESFKRSIADMIQETRRITRADPGQ